jgi:thiol:disulfide interchange protein DsbC
MHIFKILISLLLASLLVSTSVYADTETEKMLASKIKEVLGENVVINSVTQTPVKSLYEIVFDNGKVVYISDDGRYVFEGDLMDLVDRQNLTENRRTEARAMGFKNIDVNKLIEYAPEKTEHVLYVYTDIDCAYCRKFHNQMKTLNDNGIAVRYLAFPRAGLGSSAYVAAESAWCAEDKKSALTDAKAGKSIPPAVCDDRVAAQYEMGKSMGVRGTPSVYLASGKEMGGYIPAEELIRFFKGGL